ncbi:hypothetical protein Trihar35433_8942 [Trichoderma harzianum]|nr:hypothetical protein Trihar35433_8942 [Trichoderma harzianum]
MDVGPEQAPIQLFNLSQTNDDCLKRLEDVDRKLIISIDTGIRFKHRIESWLQENPSKSTLLLTQVKQLPSVLNEFLSQLEEASLDKAALKRANIGRLLGHMYASIDVATEAIPNHQFAGTDNTAFTRLVDQIALMVEKLDRFNQLSINLSQKDWEGVEKRFLSLAEAFDSAYSDIRDLKATKTNHTSPLRKFSRLSLAANDSAPLPPRVLDSHPIVMLPLRNAKFFGRESILNEIGQTLQNSPSATEPIAITLNGLGGIGKSQIAREYAYRWKAQYGIILWIESETALSLDQSLRKAAVELKLANVSQTDSLQNKVAVRGKLERSETPWLVIFDNLNEASAIEDFWPRGGLGSIIVTSVVSDVVFNLNPYVIKVPAFSEEEAIGCFLDQLALDNKDELNKNSAAKINQELGGHPLAIVRVAAFARSCKFRIEECAEQIELALDEARDASPIKNYDDYLKDISTVWKMSFKKLSEKPRAMSLLGMLSYLAAETIPEVLFTPKLSRGELSDDLLFCSNSIRLKVVEGNLLNWGLIEKDLAGNLSLHRLVQKEVQHFLNEGQKQDAFDQITFLLYHAFPKQDKGQYLHDHWEQGNLFVNHIVTLNRHYLDTSSPQIFPSLHYIRLLSNCAWFLYEKGNNIEARTIIIGGLNACEKLKTKSKSDEIHVIYAHILNTSALLDGFRGFFDSQIEKLNLVLEIRKRVLAENHEEISGVLNNLCLAYENAMRFSEALEYREKSLEVCWKHPESRSRDLKIKKRDLTFTRLLLATDRPEEAKALFPGLLQYFKSINNWFLIGQLFIPWGNYQFAVRDFEGSKESFLYALKQYEDVGKVMYHPDATACLYKIGRAALEEGDLVYAIEKFREAIRRLQLADPKSPQIGRVYFMLSKALKKMGFDNTDEMRMVEKEIRDIVQALRPQHDLSVEITEALLDSLVCGMIR